MISFQYWFLVRFLGEMFCFDMNRGVRASICQVGSCVMGAIQATGPKQTKTADHGNVFVIASREDWESKLSDAKRNGKVVVVDFTATWCGPCRFIAPFFVELSQKYPQLLFLKVDVDDLSDISQEWDVHAMPTFLFIEGGKQVEKLVGANTAELENKVKFFADKRVLAA